MSKYFNYYYLTRMCGAECSIVPGYSVSFKSLCDSLPGGITCSDSGRGITGLGFAKPKLYHKVLPDSRVYVRGSRHSRWRQR